MSSPIFLMSSPNFPSHFFSFLLLLFHATIISLYHPFSHSHCAKFSIILSLSLSLSSLLITANFHYFLPYEIIKISFLFSLFFHLGHWLIPQDFTLLPHLTHADAAEFLPSPFIFCFCYLPILQDCLFLSPFCSHSF